MAAAFIWLHDFEWKKLLLLETLDYVAAIHTDFPKKMKLKAVFYNVQMRYRIDLCGNIRCCWNIPVFIGHSNIWECLFKKPLGNKAGPTVMCVVTKHAVYKECKKGIIPGFIACRACLTLCFKFCQSPQVHSLLMPL